MEILFEVLKADTKEIIGYERIGDRGHWEHIRPNRTNWLLGAITEGQECGIFIRRQFTGRFDKHTKKEFQGDVLKYNKCEDDSIYFHGLAYIGNDEVGGNIKIIRCDNVDQEIPEIKGEDCLDSTSFWNDDFEIIGNIHKNPELLK